MKRLLCLLFLLTGTLSGSAQKTRIYVRAGVNASYFAGPDAVRETYVQNISPIVSGLNEFKFFAANPTGQAFRSGFVGGLGLTFSGTSSRWGVRAEVNFEQRGARLRFNYARSLDPISSVYLVPAEGTGSVRLHSLTVPILLQYRMRRVFLVGGFYGSRSWRAFEKGEFVTTGANPRSFRYQLNHNDLFSRFDAGGILGIGSDFLLGTSQISAELRYQRGLVNAYPLYMGRQPVAYHENFQLTLAYDLN